MNYHTSRNVHAMPRNSVMLLGRASRLHAVRLRSYGRSYSGCMGPHQDTLLIIGTRRASEFWQVSEPRERSQSVYALIQLACIAMERCILRNGFARRRCDLWQRGTSPARPPVRPIARAFSRPPVRRSVRALEFVRPSARSLVRSLVRQSARPSVRSPVQSSVRATSFCLCTH